MGIFLFAHKLAKPLEDIYILKGYDAVGEERRSTTEEIEVSMIS